MKVTVINDICDKHVNKEFNIDSWKELMENICKCLKTEDNLGICDEDRDEIMKTSEINLKDNCIINLSDILPKETEVPNVCGDVNITSLISSILSPDMGIASLGMASFSVPNRELSMRSRVKKSRYYKW